MEQGAFRGDLSGARLTALVVGAGLVLGGCGSGAEDPEPPPPPPPIATVEPTPEPEPEVVAPVEPRPEGTPGPEDAERAAVYFVELYHYVLQTGDLEAWDRADGGDSCGFCNYVRTDAQSRVERREEFRTQGLELGPPTYLTFDDVIRTFGVEVPYNFIGGEFVSNSGDVIGTASPDSGFFVLEVAFDAAEGWQLMAVLDVEASIA